MASSSTIDLSSVIEEAGGRGQHGDAYDRATAFLQARHQAATNPHGVWEEGETVELAKVGGSEAEARLAKNGRGMWLTGYQFSHATASTSGPVSVWSRKAFATRDDAIRHEAEHASRWFAAEIVTLNSCVPDKSRAEARKMVEQLRRWGPSPEPPSIPAKGGPKPEQLSLF